MLNGKGIRELAYVVQIDAIEPILGSDNCEAAVVGGWKVMVKKQEFKPGDFAIYFEIDSKLPEAESYAFMEKKHYKVKTQKYTFGGKNKEGFYSQGLIMKAEDLGNKWQTEQCGISGPDGLHYVNDESRFVTEILNVTYADSEDNTRKSNKKPNPDAKYQRMFNRHPTFARSWFGRICTRHLWMKKILFLFWGKGCEERNTYPSWVVRTDEERIQCNFNFMRNVDTKWISTEKIDGTSTTMTLKRKGKKYEYYVCSRNVCFDSAEKIDKCFYESNVYLEMSEKYKIKDILTDMLDCDGSLDFVTIQGETYGAGVQKRDYGLKGHDFAIFNVIYGFKDGGRQRLNPVQMKKAMDLYSLPTVPIVETDITLPDTCEEILKMAGDKSKIDGGMREGLVFRSTDGQYSFKAVDNDFLLKYHG